MAAKSLLASWAKVPAPSPAPRPVVSQESADKHFTNLEDPENSEEPLYLAKNLLSSHEIFLDKVAESRRIVDALGKKETPSIKARLHLLSTVNEELDENSWRRDPEPAMVVNEVAGRLATKRAKLLETLDKCLELADVQPVEDSGVEATLRKLARANKDMEKVTAIPVPGAQLALRNVSITSEPTVDIQVAMSSSIFKQWLETISKDKRIVLAKIHFSVVEAKGSSVKFLKFRVDADVEGTRVPGIPFQRDERDADVSSSKSEPW